MITPQQRIRRRTDGTIDLDFYSARTLAERAAMRCPPRKPGRIWTLAFAAMMLGPAGALVVALLAVVGMVHILTGNPSTAAQPSTPPISITEDGRGAHAETRAGAPSRAM
jgi:hypothetical protein